jgi:hypothetical protein
VLETRTTNAAREPVFVSGHEGRAERVLHQMRRRTRARCGMGRVAMGILQRNDVRRRRVRRFVRACATILLLGTAATWPLSTDEISSKLLNGGPRSATFAETFPDLTGFRALAMKRQLSTDHPDFDRQSSAAAAQSRLQRAWSHLGGRSRSDLAGMLAAGWDG